MSNKPGRELVLEVARVTEAAAIAAGRWAGSGDKNGADGAAVTAMRRQLETVTMDGVVIIGEGEKDEAPMLYNGERVGSGEGPAVDVAVDPIDGTTLLSLGRQNSVAVMTIAESGSMFDPGPCVYMEKMAVGPSAAGSIDISRPVAENIRSVASALGKELGDVVAVILDRDRHAEIIEEVRGTGAKVRLIPDGDVAGALSTAVDYVPGDILIGIGGTPEGVIAAGALKCLGGELHAPRPYMHVYISRQRDEVRIAQSRICEHPAAWHPLEPAIRRYRLRSFPYGLIYAVENGEVVVLAVAHL
ncbi:MAG: class II fructose-bisphosphatase, partial [Acidobacteria bacterium]